MVGEFKKIMEEEVQVGTLPKYYQQLPVMITSQLQLPVFLSKWKVNR